MAEESISYEEIAHKSDRELKKVLGFWAVMFMAFDSLLGSGWLMAPLYSAAAVGPASLISWILGLVFVLFIVLSYAEIGAMIPRSGSIVRYPQYAFGGFLSFLSSWAYIVGYTAVVTAEVEAILSYLSGLFPTLMVRGVLTWEGFAVAVLFILAFFALNYYSVYLLGKLTAGLGWLKLLVPAGGGRAPALLLQPGQLYIGAGRLHADGALLARAGATPRGNTLLVLRIQAGDRVGQRGQESAENHTARPDSGIPPRGPRLPGAADRVHRRHKLEGAVPDARRLERPQRHGPLQRRDVQHTEANREPALVAFSFVVLALAILSPMTPGWSQLGSVSRGVLRDGGHRGTCRACS
jgi:Amino acid transporters